MNVTAPTPSTFNEVLADIERRIAGTRVRTKPFPHVVIDDLLPVPVRRSIDRYWPDPARLKSSNYFPRGEVPVSMLARTTEGDEQAFWRALRQLTIRAGIAARARLDRYIADKFRPLLGPDWRRVLKGAAYLDRDAMLAHYTGVIDLVPHIDHARLVVNGFVYLDDPDQPTPEPRRGTMLYKSLGFAWPSNMLVPAKFRDRFLREAEEVEWRDNRLLAYVNGPWSFHGVPRHDLGESRRRLLMFGTLLDTPTMNRIFDPEIL